MSCRLLVSIFSLIVLAGCAGNGGATMTDEEKSAEPVVVTDRATATASLGKRIRLRGRPVRTKLAPSLDAGFLHVYCIELDAWPEDLLGEEIAVEGILERTDRYRARVGPDGAVSQGTAGGDYTLREMKNLGPVDRK